MCVPAGKLAESKAERKQELFLGIWEQAVKSAWRRIPQASCESRSAAQKSDFFGHVAMAFTALSRAPSGRCCSPQEPVRALLFLTPYSWPSVWPIVSARWWFEWEKRNDTRFREGFWALCPEAHLGLESGPSPPGWMCMRIDLSRRLSSPRWFCKEPRLVTGHSALHSLQKRRKETRQPAERCARCPLPAAYRLRGVSRSKAGLVCLSRGSAGKRVGCSVPA